MLETTNSQSNYWGLLNQSSESGKVLINIPRSRSVFYPIVGEAPGQGLAKLSCPIKSRCITTRRPLRQKAAQPTKLGQLIENRRKKKILIETQMANEKWVDPKTDFFSISIDLVATLTIWRQRLWWVH